MSRRVGYTDELIFEFRCETSLDNLYQILEDFNDTHLTDIPGPLIRVKIERIDRLCELKGKVQEFPNPEDGWEFPPKVTSSLDYNGAGRFGIADVEFGHIAPTPINDQVILVRGVCYLPDYQWSIGYFEAVGQHLRKLCGLPDDMPNLGQTAASGAVEALGVKADSLPVEVVEGFQRLENVRAELELRGLIQMTGVKVDVPLANAGDPAKLYKAAGDFEAALRAKATGGAAEEQGNGRKGGRPRNAEDDWALAEVRTKGRKPQDVYPEWLARIGERAQILDDSRDSFNKAISSKRMKGKKRK
jgi:hypothetical protein